ncbi:hypothetical protein CLAIMM_11182 [Cladophialophora immunda]|nr:hypothetical protein CLAIMM_11182 [Cladophialophora immunda]
MSLYAERDGEKKSPVVSKCDLELNTSHEGSQEPVAAMVIPSINSSDQTFPDGGYKAWMTVLGGWLSFIAGIGVLTGFSVFQSYYSTVVLSGYSADDIAWIASLQTWGCFFFGMWAGRLSDRYGPKIPMAFGSFFMILGTMTASVSTKYYQFILSQGLCSALGIGFAFTPALAIQSQWFLKRRGFVVGLVMSGQNVGGVIWAILVDQFVNYHGISFGWTLRTIGFLQLALMVAAVLLIQPRFPHDMPREPIKTKTFFTDKRTLLFTLATFIMYLGIYMPYVRHLHPVGPEHKLIHFQIYIALYGYQYGSSARGAFYLASILNAGGFFGCYALGIVADAGLGFFDSLIVTTFASAVVAFAWIGARTPAGVIVWTVVYGVLSGALQAIFSPCVSLLAPSPEVIGTWNGLCISAISFAVLGGGPIGGRLLENAEGTNYVPMQVFTGVCMAVSGLMFVGTRLWVSRNMRQRV